MYDVMKSYLTCVWDKKIRYGYITLETKVGMWNELSQMIIQCNWTIWKEQNIL